MSPGHVFLPFPGGPHTFSPILHSFIIYKPSAFCFSFYILQQDPSSQKSRKHCWSVAILHNTSLSDGSGGRLVHRRLYLKESQHQAGLRHPKPDLSQLLGDSGGCWVHLGFTELSSYEVAMCRACCSCDCSVFVQQLQQEVDELADRVEQANNALRGDWARWRTRMRADLKSAFISTAAKNVDYYEKVSSAFSSFSLTPPEHQLSLLSSFLALTPEVFLFYFQKDLCVLERKHCSCKNDM